MTILVALPVAIMATTVSLHSEHTAKKIVCSFVYHFTRIRLCHASFSLYANLLSDVSCFLSNFLYANQILILFLSAIKLCCRDLATRPFIATNSCILADLLYLPFFIHCRHTCLPKLISCHQPIPMRLLGQGAMPVVPGAFNPRKSAISGCG